MNQTTLAMLPDSIFKGLAVIGILFSLVYRKIKGEWPWE